MALVVGNMVGVGVFTSLGFQLAGTPSGFPVLLLWVIGGVYALCGALCYAELAAALPRSGGEYHLLSSVYHPAAGFLAGWVSMIVGFAAPVALAASLFGTYLSGSIGIGGDGKALAVAVLAAVTMAHLWKLPFGGWFQIIVTALKFTIVVGLAIAGFANAGGGDLTLLPKSGDGALIIGGGFAISLFFVNYAYAGWNAATYVAGEIHEPARGVPRALIGGTLLVLALYVAVNAAFLLSTPAHLMAGNEEVGLIVAKHLFGDHGGSLVGGLIAFGLISAISAMTWAGPRVGQAIGQDYTALQFLARPNRHGVPVIAVLIQSAIALALLLTTTFRDIILYLEFVLNLSLAAAVAGVFWLRHTRPDLPRPYRCLGYPATPALFLAMAAYLEWRLFQMHPKEALLGTATVVLGLVVYLLVAKTSTRPAETP
jgi:APA family basic amino acid/polyamine antiporter